MKGHNTITLLDGSKNAVTFIGDITVNEHVTLHNVLFVPNVHYNPLSVDSSLF